MSFFIYHDEEDMNQKMNIDDLFEKQQQYDLKQLSIYNKLLNRVHKRIKHVSRAMKRETHIFYNVPEYIFGESVYDNKDCTGYLVANLEKNGFQVRYIHPNTLLLGMTLGIVGTRLGIGCVWFHIFGFNSFDRAALKHVP